VRRSTHKRLTEEAKREGKSVVEMLDAAVDLLEEQRLLASMEESYAKHQGEIREEIEVWDGTLRDGLPDGG